MARTHPDADGGRIARPCDLATARRLYHQRGLFLASLDDEGLTTRDRAHLHRIARNIGLTGNRRGRAATMAAEEQERVFGLQGGRGDQRACTVISGGRDDG